MLGYRLRKIRYVSSELRKKSQKRGNGEDRRVTQTSSGRAKSLHLGKRQKNCTPSIPIGWRVPESERKGNEGSSRKESKEGKGTQKTFSSPVLDHEKTSGEPPRGRGNPVKRERKKRGGGRPRQRITFRLRGHSGCKFSNRGGRTWKKRKGQKKRPSSASRKVTSCQPFRWKVARTKISLAKGERRTKHDEGCSPYLSKRALGHESSVWEKINGAQREGARETFDGKVFSSTASKPSPRQSVGHGPKKKGGDCDFAGVKKREGKKQKGSMSS